MCGSTARRERRTYIIGLYNRLRILRICGYNSLLIYKAYVFAAKLI